MPDHAAEEAVAAGGGIEAVIEATGLRTRENVLNLIDPAILDRAQQTTPPHRPPPPSPRPAPSFVRRPPSRRTFPFTHIKPPVQTGKALSGVAGALRADARVLVISHPAHRCRLLLETRRVPSDSEVVPSRDLGRVAEAVATLVKSTY